MQFKVKKQLVLSFLAALFLTAQVEAASLHQGDRGEDVRSLQEGLRGRGYSVGIDGVFGNQTLKMLKAFQRDHGLQTDGIAGALTLKELGISTKGRSGSLNSSALASRILSTAQNYLGVPYEWGGTSPSGFDCSGYTQFVFSQYGVYLPRTADLQFEEGVAVSRNQLKAGDLVFFSTYEPGPSHSGLYLGNGKFINASSSKGVSVASMNNSYWNARYVGARRVL